MKRVMSRKVLKNVDHVASPSEQKPVSTKLRQIKKDFQ